MRALVLLSLLFFAPLAAVAQDLPDWDYTSINDFAGLLNNEDVQVLDQALISLFEETDIEGTVVTITDRASNGGADGLEPFATRLFNDWGVGDARRNDGFMLLVSRDDREVRIELGSRYDQQADRIAKDIIEETILPDFRNGDMSHGIREGALDVIQHIARPYAQGQPPVPLEKSGGGVPRLLPIIVFGFFGFVGFRILEGIYRRFRAGPATCPKCGSRDLIEHSEPLTDQNGTVIGPEVYWQTCPQCGWTGDKSQRRAASRSRSRSYSSGGRRSGGRSGGRRSGGFGGGRSSGGGASGRW